MCMLRTIVHRCGHFSFPNEPDFVDYSHNRERLLNAYQGADLEGGGEETRRRPNHHPRRHAVSGGYALGRLSPDHAHWDTPCENVVVVYYGSDELCDGCKTVEKLRKKGTTNGEQNSQRHKVKESGRRKEDGVRAKLNADKQYVGDRKRNSYRGNEVKADGSFRHNGAGVTDKCNGKQVRPGERTEAKKTCNVVNNGKQTESKGTEGGNEKGIGNQRAKDRGDEMEKQSTSYRGNGISPHREPTAQQPIKTSGHRAQEKDSKPGECGRDGCGSKCEYTNQRREKDSRPRKAFQ